MLLFNLPDLGEGLADAQIREWYVKEGDTIKAEQPLVAMETAKAVVEIPAPFAGTIAKLFGAPGDTILTHQPLVGFIGESATATTTAIPATPTTHRDTGTVVGVLSDKETILQGESIATTTTPNTGVRPKATPAVRALAKKLGVDLSTLIPGGKYISLTDVQQAATTLTSTQQLTHPQSLSAMQRAMAQHMSEAHHRVVPVTVSDEANIQAWTANEDYTVRCIRAIAHACHVEPLLHASFDAQHMTYQLNEPINLVIAIDTVNGLYAPVIKNINALNDQQLRAEINRLKTSAQARALSPEDLHDGTIAMSNFGSIAGRYATLIIPIPLTAIIGIGAAREIVVLKEDKVVMNRILPISLTFDHRFITGGEATRFLRGLLDYLEQ